MFTQTNLFQNFKFLQTLFTDFRDLRRLHPRKNIEEQTATVNDNGAFRHTAVRFRCTQTYGQPKKNMFKQQEFIFLYNF